MPAVKHPASRLALAAAGLVVVCLVPARAEHLPLPPAEQQKVNDAIDFGVRFLKKTQLADGSWTPVDKPHRVGYAALPALTLLECGESVDDPVVKKAIQAVRRGSRELDRTYELALSILLLDRVGDPKDRDLIQTMALRLVAGQTMTGGWGYRCPTIGPRHQKEFLLVLQKLNPRPAPGVPPDVIARGPARDPAPPQGPAGGAATTPPPGPDKTTSPSGDPGGPSGSTSLKTIPGTPGTTAGSASGVAPLPGDPSKDPPKSDPHKPEAQAKEPRKEPPVVIPEALQQVPVLQDPERQVLVDPPRRDQEPTLATTDNSNTQFAILALWVAQRYDVPMERTMNLIVRRFQTSQNADGSWSYRYRFGGGEQERNTMDCVGLIGLAVGHGVSAPAGNGAVARKNVQDPRILNGFVALSRHVGVPTGRMFNLEQANLYYLWSLERVAVIYGLPTIANRDWYRWGAEMLVANQQPLGNWTAGQYHGASPVLDTCMALLFLKTAHLVKDLADRLPIDPDALAKAVNDRLTATPAKPESPPPPPEPPTPLPPPETTTAKEPPPPPPPQEAQPPAPVSPPAPEGSNRKLWGFLLLGVFLILTLVSLLLLWQYNAQKKQGGESKGGSTKGTKTARKDKAAGGRGATKSGGKNHTPTRGTAKG